MKAGILKARGGRIIVEEDLLRSMRGGEGQQLDLAIDDGWIDYNYCRSDVTIDVVLAEKETIKVKGKILYGGSWKEFEGTYKKGEVNFDFAKEPEKTSFAKRVLGRITSCIRINAVH